MACVKIAGKFGLESTYPRLYHYRDTTKGGRPCLFCPTNRMTNFLLPPATDEQLPQRHLARFVVEVIDGLDLTRLSQLATQKPVDLLVFWSVVSQGRHHSGRCHYDTATLSGIGHLDRRHLVQHGSRRQPRCQRSQPLF
jgi:hypothetical protein